MCDFREVPGVQRPSACGNGKTSTMVNILYQEFIQKNAIIVTNFHTRHLGMEFGTPSWTTYMTSQEIFDRWFELDEGTVIGITELQSLLNSAARNSKLIAYIEKCLQQRRKSEFTIVWDSQELGSGDKRWRDATDFIYRPVKYHCRWDSEENMFLPTDPCPLDICPERHQIFVYQEKPIPGTIKEMLKPVMIFNSWEIGQLFNTKEKMEDTLSYNPRWADATA